MKNDLTQNRIYRRVRLILVVITILLAVLVAGIPGVLALMRRADAQTALGNAKSLRIALETASTECYAAGRPFSRTSCPGGVTEEVWREVIADSKVPGDFWVLQTEEDGLGVLRFYYREGDFTVIYCKEPLTWEVYYEQSLIRTDFPERT